YLNIVASNADTKGIKSDTLRVSGGELQITASGNQTKAMKATAVYFTGGNTEIIASGATVVSDGDPSYCSGIKAVNAYISDGTLTITCPQSNDGGRGISCDESVFVTGGNTTISVAGNGGSYTNTQGVADTYSATCIKADVSVVISAGTVSLTASGTDSRGISCDGIVEISDNADVEIIASGQESKGIKSDTNINIFGGNLSMTLSGKVSKGLKADSQVNITAGTININATGSNLTTSSDESHCIGIKSEGTVNISGGVIEITLSSATGGAKGIASESDMTISGGQITISTAGIGATITTSTGYGASAIKCAGNLTITGGELNLTSTGKGGKGIKVDGNLVIGEQNGGNDKLYLYVQTSGAPVSSSSGGGGGWPGQSGGSSSTAFKGLPKAIKVLGDITINSGKISAYCSQTSGDPTGEAIESKASITINGGFVEANAYDDAINCSTAFTVNGGYVWAYSRGNDGIDCNGSATSLNGGVVIAAGTEEAIDANCDGMGGVQGHLYINGSTIIAFRASSGGMGGGGMALLDSPTYQNGQKYVSPSSMTAGSTYCLKNSSGEAVVVYEHKSVTGSGFENESINRPPPQPGGSSSSYVITSPQITTGTYTLYTNPTISDDANNWHGFKFGYSSVETSGSGTSLNAQ
ncbi:MAG: carbohydrate-binding domain-containing protein, partial [Bacteroidales bacterium]|nr:carbohydrate-binding domain-containing protein [Bacteroidales bacterium]